MAGTITYGWLVYGSGGPDNPVCQMDVYNTDSGQPAKETLHGADKARAILVVAQDRAIDEAVGNYTQITIDEKQRWYYRTSKRTGNSWEVILDANDQPLDDPCCGDLPANPRDLAFMLHNASVSLKYFGAGNVVLTVSGRLPQA